MIPLWKGKNPIHFEVNTIIPFDNLYRRAYFVMHTFLIFKKNSCLTVLRSIDREMSFLICCNILFVFVSNIYHKLSLKLCSCTIRIH